MPDYLVLEPGPPPAATDVLRGLAADLAAERGVIVAGWQVRQDEAAAAVCFGEVSSAADAAAAVLAAVSGARLVVAARAERDVIDQLCDDLRRLGEVDHRLGEVAPPVLTQEQRALLAELLGGATLGDAARRLHLSRRTADRRLASARAALGVGTTAEALAAAARILGRSS